MKLTNKNNLPNVIYQAVKNDRYRSEADISVTGLIEPPRIRQLKKRHSKQIQIDVTEFVFPLIGNNAHAILERANVADSLQEERLFTKVHGWTVSGQPDFYENKILSDLKITSMWTVLNGVKDDWTRQLNPYAFMYREYGFEVDGLQVIAILRDWSKVRAVNDPSYPQLQVETLDVEMWPHDKTGEYLFERVLLHQHSEDLPDNKLPLCTREEMWEKETRYAVIKKGNKKATKTMTTEDAATQLANRLQIEKQCFYKVQERKSERVRCEYFCYVKDFCNQYQQYREDLNGSDSEGDR